MTACTICGATTHTYLCDPHTTALRELLTGTHNSAHGQPGIVWYCEKLREQAYRQARMGDGPVSFAEGFAQLPDARATDLLFRIRVTLEAWAEVTYLLVGSVGDDNGPPPPTIRRHLVRASDGHLGRFLAYNTRTLTKCADVARLHDDLLTYAKAAYLIINRPFDVCCGPCPAPDNTGAPCGVLLYAEDDTTTVVACPKCRTKHDVHTLRAALREQVRDMLFTAPELRRLMSTRLGEPISRSYWHKLVATGRLTPRSHMPNGVPMFAYHDVRQAREKVNTAGRKRALA